MNKRKIIVHSVQEIIDSPDGTTFWFKADTRSSKGELTHTDYQQFYFPMNAPLYVLVEYISKEKLFMLN